MNATNTHTPGPWTYGWEGAHTEPTLGRPCVGTTGAADWVGPYGAEADARLIAAAPALLAACEEIDRLSSSPLQSDYVAPSVVALARAALRLARGA